MLTYLDIDPARGVRYWTKLTQNDGIFKSGDDVDEALIETKGNEQVDALRLQQIMNANNELKLLTVATLVIRHKRISSIKLIKSLLGDSEAPGDIARGIMLAGFLDDSPAVTSLWNKELAVTPLQGWIQEVYQRAGEHPEDVQCLHWLGVSLNASDDESFFSACTIR